MSYKESTTKRTAQGNEIVGLDGSSSRQQCWTGTKYTERYGSTNLRRSTGTKNIARNLNLKKEDKKNLAVAAQQSGSWAGVRSVCAFSMLFHAKKIRCQVCLEPDLYVATRCHAFRSSCDVALASPIGPLRIDVTVTAKWPLLVLRNVTPFMPSHFRQSSEQIFWC